MPRKLNRVFDIFLSILSGAILALPFNNPRLWILAWFAFIPLFLSLNNKTLKQSFLLSFATGATFWAGSIFWLVNVTLVGTILLILYLALYFGAFGLIIRPQTKRSQPYVFLFVPSVWVMLEYARSHLLTGFPWSLLGYSQYLNLPVIQIADITGVWGVSFLVMFMNAAGVEIIHSLKARLNRRLKAAVILVILIFSLVLSYGYFRLGVFNNPEKSRQLRITLIQGDIPQELKWEPGSREFVMERYLKLTSEALKDAPDLIVWPEAALPVVLGDEPVYYKRLLSYANTIARPILFGAVTYSNGAYYNSALLLSGEGRLVDQYDKVHLVPFGEYIPFRKAFTFLETIAPIGDISRGTDYTIFDISTASRPRLERRARNEAFPIDTGPALAAIPGRPDTPVMSSADSKQARVSGRVDLQHRFGVLICFEDVFPGLSRRFIKEGAGFLINITNDAWFGKTSEASQHMAASVFRAVENRINLVRAANTGISGFIDPRGKALSLVSDAAGNNIFIPGYLTQNIYLNAQPTFYGHYGDLLVILCLICVVYILVLARKQKPKK
ncbi:MAG: apolipoprotein N-acyltransferase [Candidatus Omnitrophota bacterium]